MKINTDHVFKPGEIGKVCTLKNVYIDLAGTIPAKVGDKVARVDWDDAEPDAIRLHPDNHPTLAEGGNGSPCLFFPGGLQELQP